MKNIVKLVGITVLVAVIGIAMASCGGGDPKSLAKQSYDIQQEALAATTSADLTKVTQLLSKSAEIEAKVKKLSEKDQEIYAAEYLRLSLGGR